MMALLLVRMHFCMAVIRYALSGVDELFFARSACCFSEHFDPDPVTTERLFPCGWMMEVSGVWGKAGAVWWRWENPVPQDWGSAGEMRRTEDKRNSLYCNILNKSYVYSSPTQTLSRLLCLEKIFHSCISAALFTWVLEPVFVWVFFELEEGNGIRER